MGKITKTVTVASLAAAILSSTVLPAVAAPAFEKGNSVSQAAHAKGKGESNREAAHAHAPGQQKKLQPPVEETPPPVEETPAPTPEPEPTEPETPVEPPLEDPEPTKGPWAPEAGVNTQWQWQLDGTPEYIPGVNIYSMDGEMTTADEVASLESKGANTIRYISGGTIETWRDDAASFPASVQGNDTTDWGGEKWLDISQVSVLSPLMAERMDDCAVKGFDAVQVDNVDGYTKSTGFDLTAEQQLTYNKVLAKLAHERGMSVALMNDEAQTAELEPHFDFAINEGVFTSGNFDAYAPFTNAQKAVLNVEYADSADRCMIAGFVGISSMLKNVELDAYRESCSTI